MKLNGYLISRKKIMMKRIRSFEDDGAKLYLVATPIGNLEDITFRAVSILKSCDMIFCEDTRTSSVLLKHYEIKKPLKSYHDHNEHSQKHVVLEQLLDGKTCAIISDAGHPLISDPGLDVVRLVQEHDIPVVSVPGPSAFITGLSMSALPTHPFMFYGFLAHKSGKQIKQLEPLRNYPYTMIFYESPHRINQTLSNMAQVFGNRQAVIARELTKKFEEVLKGTLEELALVEDLKGEMVVIVEGLTETEDSGKSLLDEVFELIEQGVSSKEAIKVIAKRHDVPKNDVYQLYHNE